MKGRRFLSRRLGPAPRARRIGGALEGFVLACLVAAPTFWFLVALQEGQPLGRGLVLALFAGLALGWLVGPLFAALPVLVAAAIGIVLADRHAFGRSPIFWVGLGAASGMALNLVPGFPFADDPGSGVAFPGTASVCALAFWWRCSRFWRVGS